MTTIGLILRELLHRKVNFALSVLAIVTAVALFAAFLTAREASGRETTRIMRDLGFNVRIVPKDTDMAEFYRLDFSRKNMPEECVHRMAGDKDLLYNHLLAILQEEIEWRGRKVILTGISEEVAPVGKETPPMIFSVKPGTVHVGFELARAEGIAEGDDIDVLGETFEVAQCQGEKGTQDDIRIYGNLADVQRLLDKPGKINEIKALECLCLTNEADQLKALRDQLAKVLPEARMIKIQDIALARHRQRLMVERLFGIGMPFVLVVCAAWVGVLAMLNVRERRQEIGILRALGYRSGKIASLFLGKAVLTGVLGALIGFGMGTGLALLYGPDVFKVTAQMIKPSYGLLGWMLMAAPALAALSSLIPAVVAVTQDPAVTLREE